MHDIFRIRNKTQAVQSLKINTLLKKLGLMVYVLTKEADYYCQLKLLTRAGEIKGFCRQARFVVTEGVGSIERGTEYVADFVIFNNDGTSRIVDTKGVKTNEFKLKMKSFREKYPTLKVELE